MDNKLLDQYKTKLLRNKYKIKRNMFDVLFKEIQNHNIILIGLRQLGKTILTEQLVQKYIEINKKVRDSKEFIHSNSEDNNFLYMNLKAFTDTTKETILNTINGQGFKIVLIDEVQKINEWSDLAQSLVDMNPNTRFILTGSNVSSLASETTFRRFKIFNLFPLEYNEYKKIWNDDNFEKYLNYGSYPKSENYIEPGIQYMETIEDLIIDKIGTDDNLGLDIMKFKEFVKIISNYIGSEINSKEIADNNQIARPTIKNYITIMKRSMLIRTISKLEDKNQHTKEKVYFTDKSMLPFFKKDMKGNEYGSLIENLVYMKLVNKYESNYSKHEIQYFRNARKSEIDFIIPEKKILIEVKYQTIINFNDLTNKMNKTLDGRFNDYEKIVITKNQEKQINGWKFMPLLEFIEGE